MVTILLLCIYVYCTYMWKLLRRLILIEEGKVWIKMWFFFLRGSTPNGGRSYRGKQGETSHADKQGQLGSFDEVGEEVLI